MKQKLLMFLVLTFLSFWFWYAVMYWVEKVAVY